MRYADSFFHEVCNGTIKGGEVFSSIAVDVATNKIVGFILAQMQNVHQCEDQDLFSGYQRLDDKVLYILTIGVKSEHRRMGLASALVKQCIDLGSKSKDCGAVLITF